MSKRHHNQFIVYRKNRWMWLACVIYCSALSICPPYPHTFSVSHVLDYACYVLSSSPSVFNVAAPLKAIPQPNTGVALLWMLKIWRISIVRYMFVDVICSVVFKCKIQCTHARISKWEAHACVFRRLSFAVMRGVAEQFVGWQLWVLSWLLSWFSCVFGCLCYLDCYLDVGTIRWPFLFCSYKRIC